jgi:hypothetical protein
MPVGTGFTIDRSPGQKVGRSELIIPEWSTFTAPSAVFVRRLVAIICLAERVFPGGCLDNVSSTAAEQQRRI